MTNLNYVDIHCHPTLKPFYSSMHHEEKIDIWKKINVKDLTLKHSKLTLKQVQEMIKFSQVNLNASKKAGLGILFAVLYPVEREWFDKSRLIRKLSKSEKMLDLSIHTSGIDKTVMENIIKVIRENTNEINYFEELAAEYYYLTSDQAKSANANNQFKVVNDYSEIENAKNNPAISEIIIVTIEGGHSLCSFKNHEALEKTPFKNVNDRDKSDFKNFQKIFFDNIDVIKGKKDRKVNIDFSGTTKKNVHFAHTPFYITFAHHFWNLLCGHADSISVLQGLVLQQRRAEGRKFSELGLDVLHKLLKRDENERRVLIDIKHLGIKARKQFFEIWEDDYNDEGDPFPIICSHSAVNGLSSYYRAGSNELEDDVEDAFFNTSSINMYDHDIRMVYKSDGLIGIILNEGRLPGADSRQSIKFNKRRIRKNEKDIKKHPDSSEVQTWKHEIKLWKEENRQEYLKCIVANIFHIARVCKKKKGWDIITIGSDFDGMINALDSYQTAEDFPVLEKDLQKYIEKINGIEEIGMSRADMDVLIGDYSAKQIVEKVMKTNAIEFLRKYFHDDFLKFGNKH